MEVQQRVDHRAEVTNRRVLACPLSVARQARRYCTVLGGGVCAHQWASGLGRYRLVPFGSSEQCRLADSNRQHPELSRKKSPKPEAGCYRSVALSIDSPVFVDERHEQIVALVEARGRVRIGELTAMFGVSERTISKDLKALHARRLVKRIHGGAIALRPRVELDLEDRAARNAEAKDAIALACLREIQDGYAIFLGSGSTVQRIADHLAADLPLRARNLTILTNSVGVAHAVADQPTIDHVLLGGHLRRVSGCTTGQLTREELERFTVNVAFIGVSALSEDGVSVSHLDEALVTAAVVERARRVIVPLVHDKLGASDFANICDLGALDTIVTDRAGDELRGFCEEHDVRLIEADRAVGGDGER